MFPKVTFLSYAVQKDASFDMRKYCFFLYVNLAPPSLSIIIKLYNFIR
jgi:hypothetical protein